MREDCRKWCGGYDENYFISVFPSHPLLINMKTKKVNCENCGREFEKLLKEYKRSEKLKRKHFCNRSCAMSYVNNHKTKEFWQENYKHQKKTFDIKSQCSNKRDEYSPFRFFLNRGHSSVKKHTVDIDEKYLKEIWEKQRGICPYTGIKMILPQSTHKSKSVKSLKRASLDRIDSSNGYMKGNVEFVCMAINNAKNNFTKKETESFIKEIVSSQNTLSITQGQPT